MASQKPGKESLVLGFQWPDYRFARNTMPLTKSQIVDALAERTGVEKKAAEAVLE